MPDSPSPHTRLQRRHAVLLVLAVLAVHLWLISDTPLWLPSPAETPAPTQAMVTRQIPMAAPRAPQRPVASPAAGNSLGKEETTQASPTPVIAPREIEDLTGQLTAPVALPARAASAVDLPPFKRQASGNGQATEATMYAPPEPALLKFDVRGTVKQLNYSAWGELLWQPHGTRYEARMEIGAFLLGSRVQTSAGLIGADGLMPERFVDKSRNALEANFHRDQNLISFSAQTPDVPLMTGAQDRLSVVLQLSTLLAGDPSRFPPGTTLSFQTVSQRDAEVWQFRVDKEESLTLPFGTLETIKMSRTPRRPMDQLIELWFAPSLQYLPVRLRVLNADGDQVDQLMRRLEKPGP